MIVRCFFHSWSRLLAFTRHSTRVQPHCLSHIGEISLVPISMLLLHSTSTIANGDILKTHSHTCALSRAGILLSSPTLRTSILLCCTSTVQVLKLECLHRPPKFVFPRNSVPQARKLTVRSVAFCKTAPNLSILILVWFRVRCGKLEVSL